MRLSLLSCVPFVLLLHACWAASPPVKVSLKTSWPAPPFLLEILETISLETPESFHHLLNLVTDPNVLQTPDVLSPEALLSATLEIAGEAGYLGLSSDTAASGGSLAFVNMGLGLHVATPRIQAMYDYISNLEFVGRGKGEGGCEAWVDWYGQQICDIESLVQLTGHETIDSANTPPLTNPYPRPKLLPLDHIYPPPGLILDRPPRTAILYGSLTCPKFRELHEYLYGMASLEGTHVEYVVRPMLPKQNEHDQENGKKEEERIYLSGYGVSLDLKKTDYLAVDDRLAGQKVFNDNAEEIQVPDAISELINQFPVNESAPDASVPLTPEELEEIGAKAVQMIMTSPQPFPILKQLSQNFPKYASAIARGITLVNSSIADELELNTQHVPPGTNAMWVNGVSVQDKDISPLGFLRMLKKEREAVLALSGSGSGRLGMLENAGHVIELLTHDNIREASSSTKSVVDGMIDASDRLEEGGVVIWWNDIEKDEKYAKWSASLQQLLRPLYPGQFHQVKANLFNIIITADLTQTSALNFLIGPMSNIMDRGYPFRFGFVPNIETEDGLTMAYVVSYLAKNHGSKITLSFLKNFAQKHAPQSSFIDRDLVRSEFHKAIESSKSEEEETDLPEVDFEAVARGEGEKTELNTERTEAYLRRVGATLEDSLTGHAFVNGKHFKLDENFMGHFQNEIGQQLQYFQEKVYNKKITGDDIETISTHFYDLPTSSSRRSQYTIPSPSGPGSLRFASIPDLESRAKLGTRSNLFLQSDSAIVDSVLPVQVPISVYVIADLDSRSGRSLVKEALFALTNNPAIIPFRLALLHNPVDTEEDDLPDRLPTSWYIAYLIHNGDMATTDPRKLLEAIETFAQASSIMTAEDAFKELTGGITLSSIEPIVHHTMLVEGRLVARELQLLPGEQGFIVNGRVVGPVESAKFTADEMTSLVEYEYRRRAEPIVMALQEIEPSILTRDNSVTSHLLLVASSIISSIQVLDPSEAGLFDAPQRPRTRNYQTLGNTYTGFEFGDNSTAVYQLTALIDPLSVTAQKWISLLEWLTNVPDIYIEVRLNPRPTKEMPLKQFYRYNVQPELSFDTNGFEVASETIFTDLPLEPIYTMAMDVPASWLVRPREALYDLDNIQLGQLSSEDKSLDATFQLDYLVVEGHAREDGTGSPPRGVQLELLDGDMDPIDDTLVVANLGYIQFKTRPGVFTLDIRPGRGRDVYTLLSVGNEGWDSPAVAETGPEITVASFEGVTLYPRLTRNPGMESEDVLESPDENDGSNLFESISSRFTSLFNPTPEKKQAEINIFTVASGLLYERFASIMILSVLRNTKHTVKFWFIENFLSPSFLEFIPHFAKEYNFDYELVTYKWPSWLRAQTEKQRIIWAYKILFLDVLFPMDLKKVIFVDADQIVRADLKELVDLDLQGAPYGYTPMGDDSYDMDGFRFWKTGYWREFLGDLPYHISALYVVDLVRFRQMAAGDMLRHHYQQLSADPNSLANLDQDLPNNLQQQVPIFSLHEDWLWCETWCSADRFDRAKTIDLCQNPLTKEPKLSRARKIPEWELYDGEIFRFTRKLAEEGLIHSRLAAADTTVLAGSKKDTSETEDSTVEVGESPIEETEDVPSEEITDDRVVDEL